MILCLGVLFVVAVVGGSVGLRSLCLCQIPSTVIKLTHVICRKETAYCVLLSVTISQSRVSICNREYDGCKPNYRQISQEFPKPN